MIDLESDDYRWMGPARFDMKGVAVIMQGNSHKGKLSFVPETWEKKTPNNALKQVLPPPIRVPPPGSSTGAPVHVPSESGPTAKKQKSSVFVHPPSSSNGALQHPFGSRSVSDPSL